jgi:hypothetical protein
MTLSLNNDREIIGDYQKDKKVSQNEGLERVLPSIQHTELKQLIQ